MKIAIIFPGQGAQYIGMGKEFYDSFPELQKYYNIAIEVLGYDIKKIIFEGPETLLVQTNYTQPAVFLTSYICFKALETKIPSITQKTEFVAGHSLGEYTAVCVSGAMSFEDGIKVVSSRGEIMAEVGKTNPGTMMAVLGITKEELIPLCNEINKKLPVVEPVNFNCPGQIVVAGTIQAIEELSNLLTDKKIKCIRLNVSGAFHSSLMNEAQKNFLAPLDNLNLNNALLKVVMNYDAMPHLLNIELKENLKQQINHPVLWEDSIRYMIANGVELFIECGPGKVLSGMIKKIDRKVNVLNIENLETLNHAENYLTR